LHNYIHRRNLANNIGGGGKIDHTSVLPPLKRRIFLSL